MSEIRICTVCQGEYIFSDKPYNKRKCTLCFRKNKTIVRQVLAERNGCVSNLEWCNQFENMQHAFKLGLNTNPYGEKHNRSVITEEIYFKCVILREQGLTYIKIAEHVSKEYNIKIGRTAINAALLGQTWSHLKTKNLRSYENRKSKVGY